MFLEFFDGVWGHYTFESDKVNVLIDGLPSFAYPLGQVIFVLLVYRLLVHQYFKKFLTINKQKNKKIIRERKSNSCLIVILKFSSLVIKNVHF